MNNEFDISCGRKVMGIDEVGRGSLIGPVVAASVVVEDWDKIPQGIMDSKKLTPKRRELLNDILRQNCKYAIGMSSIEEIEEYNILGATKLAMIRAYKGIKEDVDVVLIDGNQLPDLSCNMRAVINGDNISISIAIASIIAKVERDNLIIELSNKYPQYKWDSNKGYATKTHREAIIKYGATPLHRKKFLDKIISKAQA